MKERLLPPDLQQRVRAFYVDVWAPQSGGRAGVGGGV